MHVFLALYRGNTRLSVLDGVAVRSEILSDALLLVGRGEHGLGVVRLSIVLPS